MSKREETSVIRLGWSRGVEWYHPPPAEIPSSKVMNFPIKNSLYGRCQKEAKLMLFDSAGREESNGLIFSWKKLPIDFALEIGKFITFEGGFPRVGDGTIRLSSISRVSAQILLIPSDMNIVNNMIRLRWYIRIIWMIFIMSSLKEIRVSFNYLYFIRSGYLHCTMNFNTNNLVHLKTCLQMNIIAKIVSSICVWIEPKQYRTN